MNLTEQQGGKVGMECFSIHINREINGQILMSELKIIEFSSCFLFFLG